MTTALLLPLLLLPQEPNPLVTYATAAKSADKVLADLSKTTGVRFKANFEASKEIVLVSIKDMPLQNLMARLAAVTDCTWNHSGAGYTLTPALGLRAKQERQELEQRAATLGKNLRDRISVAEKALADVRKETKPTTGDDVASASPDDLMGQLTLLKVLSGIGSSELAEIKQTARVVYASNDQTRMQRLIPNSDADGISSWISLHNKSLASGQASQEGASDTFEASIPNSLRELAHRLQLPILQPPAKALVIIDGASYEQGIQATLYLLNLKGEIILETATGISNTDETRSAEPTKSPATTTPVEYSDESKQFAGVFTRTGVFGARTTVADPAYRRKVLRPDLFDPLSFATSDQFLSVAKLHGRQIVADVPDAAFAMVRFLAKRRLPSVEQTEMRLRSSERVSIADDGVALLVKPFHPVHERISRMDRRILADLCGAKLTKGMPSLDDMADCAVQCPDPWENIIGSQYLSWLAPVLRGSESGWDALRLWHYLTLRQREELLAGGPIDVASLAGPARDCFSNIAFAGLLTDESIVVDRDMEMLTGSDDSGSELADFRDEPTEAMPDGLPLRATLTAKATDDPVLFPVDPKGESEFSMAMPTDMLAMLEVTREERPQSNAFYAIPKNAKLGNCRSITLELHVAPGRVVRRNLADISLPSDASVVEMENLPADIRAKVDAMKAAYKKYMASGQGNGPGVGSGVIPPGL